jgi:lipid A 4'-phosphatase
VPGLLVNLGLKEHVGRARAVNLEQFGGDARFTPAFVPSDEEGGSFSSGHAATGFWVVAVAYSLSGRFGPWAVVALVYAVVLSLARIASGGHFPSDVLASAFFVLMGWFVLCALTRPRGEA